MIRKIRKKIRKSKVKDLVPNPSAVAQKAANLNPLSDRNSEPTIVEDVPRITNETIAVHREEVLSGARKYIYPLAHSKHRIIIITTGIILTTLSAFFIYCLLGLYRFHQNNTFLYRVTQVVPFPIAKVGDNYVDYENYLFELRHYIHYYQSQQQKDFSGDDKEQLAQFRRTALEDVVNDAYVKKLAKQNHVKVSSKEIDARINELRNQNRLGSNKVFSDVLKNYWGWSVSDFKKSLSKQILKEKVVAKLDVANHGRADDANNQLKNGADFAALAKAVSDDESTKSNGGAFGIPISRSNPNIPPQVTSELFKLKPGQISGIITTGSTLEIVKVLGTDGTNVTASHISFKLKDISVFINQIKAKEATKKYVSL